MNKILPIFVFLLNIALLLGSGLILFTVVGLSAMMFDAGESPTVWAFFAIICTICLGLMGAALYIGTSRFRRKKYGQSILGCALPLIAFALFQLALQMIA